MRAEEFDVEPPLETGRQADRHGTVVLGCVLQFEVIDNEPERPVFQAIKLQPCPPCSQIQRDAGFASVRNISTIDVAALDAVSGSKPCYLDYLASA
jgi:hypothetical protein